MGKYILSAFLLCTLCISTASYAQLEIKFGKTEINTNETFQIAIIISNENVQSMTPFPAIPSFRRSGSSQSTSMQVVNGRARSTFTIIQEYMPEKEGTFKVKPFEMKVNGKKVTSQGTKIKVAKSEGKDPFAMFFDQNMTTADDASIKSFLAFSVDKKEVYIGEGFQATLAFYKHVSEKNLIDFDYATFNVQRAEISRKLRPSNCWEEKLEQKLFEERVQINGELYIKEIIGQSYLFPMNEDSIVFPAVNLRMEKKGIVSYGAGAVKRLRHDGYKTFQTKAVEVKVKPLPPHPLKDKVNVGQYSLIEYVDTTQSFKTGNSFLYKLRILGNGNITSLKEMVPPKNKGMDFFLSETDQQIIHTVDTIYGARDFLYHVEPTEPGVQPLKNYIEWVYFNPQNEQYDTLQSKLTLQVSGKSIIQKEITTAYNTDSFYGNIESADNELIAIQSFDWQKIAINLLILLSVGAVIGLNYRKKEKEEIKKPENTNPFL